MNHKRLLILGLIGIVMCIIGFGTVGSDIDTGIPIIYLGSCLFGFVLAELIDK